MVIFVYKPFVAASASSRSEACCDDIQSKSARVKKKSSQKTATSGYGKSKNTYIIYILLFVINLYARKKIVIRRNKRNNEIHKRKKILDQ